MRCTDSELINKLDEAEKHIRIIKSDLNRTHRDQTQLRIINSDAQALLKVSKDIQHLAKDLERNDMESQEHELES